VAAGAVLAFGQVIREVVDTGLKTGSEAALNRSLMLFLAVVLTMAGAILARSYLLSWIGERVIADIRAAVFGRVLGLEPGQPPYRVLVAEDHPDNRALIHRLLGDAGFAVRLAEDGQQAVELFGEWHPHLILMDMRMPVLDGYEATRRIRALPGGSEVKIVALTASAFREERDAILATGCDEMVRKPIEEERLFDEYWDRLDRRMREEEAKRPKRRRSEMTLDEIELLSEMDPAEREEFLENFLPDDEPPLSRRAARKPDECPLCGLPAQTRCRCKMAESTCPNGHKWHLCPIHGTPVLGHRGVLGLCSCGLKRPYPAKDHA
jgi:CheY-like chemotaxis protein